MSCTPLSNGFSRPPPLLLLNPNRKSSSTHRTTTTTPPTISAVVRAIDSLTSRGQGAHIAVPALAPLCHPALQVAHKTPVCPSAHSESDVELDDLRVPLDPSTGVVVVVPESSLPPLPPLTPLPTLPTQASLTGQARITMLVFPARHVPGLIPIVAVVTPVPMHTMLLVHRTQSPLRSMKYPLAHTHNVPPSTSVVWRSGHGAHVELPAFACGQK